MWKSIYLYYYDATQGGCDDIITDLIPGIRELIPPETVQAFYFQRHWLKGPHVRFHFDVLDDAFWPELRKLIGGRIGEFLHNSPSNRILNREEWMKVSAKLASIEDYEDESITSLEPNNTWKEHDYVIRSDMYGGERGSQLAESFLSACVPLSIEIVKNSYHDQDARLICLMKMMIALVASTGNLDISHFSYRSHSEAFLAGVDQDGRIRGQFTRSFRSQRDYLVTTMSDVVEHVQAVKAGTQTVEDWLLTPWLEIVKEFSAYIRSAVQDGLEPVSMPEETAPDWITKVPSDFHRTVYQSAFGRYYLPRQDFKVVRFLLNFMYAVFAGVGLTPLQRYYLCYLSAETVEAILGKTWRDIVEEFPKTLVTTDSNTGNYA